MNILIAEDDPVSRRRLESFLQKWGHQVATAASGAQAWQLFEQGNYPIVITDWMMPEMDGLELIRRIRATPHSGYVYVILLTARSQKEDVVVGIETGANDFLTKPFDHDELRVRLGAGERIIQLEQSLAEQNRRLRDTQAALYQSEKLASLGQLAAGMAHEINNPIAYVTNNVAVLRRDILAVMEVLDSYRAGYPGLVKVEPALAAEAARLEEAIDLPYVEENLPRLFERTLEGLQRVRDIVRNLRDFARLDEADFKDVDLNAALGSTLEILRHEIKKKSLHLETELANLPLVACHPGKINQVFLNLLVNAVQACDNGGTIRIRTRAEPSRVLVEIEDNGSGIRPEHLPHIFEPFFTTKPIGQGTGLGLSVSYGIIRDHGGTIGVESTVGRGSVFRVRLPVPAAGGGKQGLILGEEMK